MSMAESREKRKSIMMVSQDLNMSLNMINSEIWLGKRK